MYATIRQLIFLKHFLGPVPPNSERGQDKEDNLDYVRIWEYVGFEHNKRGGFITSLSFKPFPVKMGLFME